MTWKWLLLGLLSACATTSGSLTHEAESCSSFAEFDARTRERLEALLAEAPGDVLVKESSRLNTARRTCARHVIGELRELRERDGIEAVQRELDAMSATYQADDLRSLMRERLGEELPQLEPLLAEARQRVTREAGTERANARDGTELAKLKVEAPESLGAEPEFPQTLCDAVKSCERLRCIAEHHAPLELTARACLNELASLESGPRAVGLGEVLSLLPTTSSPARTEAMTSLETLRRQQWPQVEAAIAAQHPGRAAQLALPFRALPSATAQVESLRDTAQAHHLARAKALAAFPDAAWLHRKLAEEFGGPTAPPLSGTGTWSPVRWRCPAEQPTLPPLPKGLDGVLTIKCSAPQKTQEPKGTETTFELEREMNGQKVTGSLTIACADKVNLNTVTADDLASLPQELARLIDFNVGACTRLHGYAAVRSCTELRKRSDGELITRFVGHAHFTRRWEPCFVEWLEATEGVAPPAVPDASVK